MALRAQRESIQASLRRGADMKYVAKTAKELYDWMTSPEEGKAVPKFMTDVVGNFLMSIEFGSSHRSGNKNARSWHQTMMELASAVSAYEQGIEEGSDRFEGIQLDIDPNMSKFISVLADSMKQRNVQYLQDLNAEELGALKTLVGSLKKTVRDFNKLNTVKRAKNLKDLGEEQIETAARTKVKKNHNGWAGTMDRLVNLEGLDSFRFFERLGPAGKAISKALSDGHQKYAGKIKEASKFTSEMMTRNNVTWKDLTNWDEHSNEFTLSSGEKSRSPIPS